MDFNAITFSLFQIVPDHFDLEVVSCNLSCEDEPKTIISIANDAQVFCNFTIIANEKYVLNEKGPQKLDITYKG